MILEARAAVYRGAAVLVGAEEDRRTLSQRRTEGGGEGETDLG